MIKNRTTQSIFQTIYCTLGVIGIIASLGIFDYTFRSDFFVHFTNLSNYLCISLMFAELFQTIKKKDDSYVTVMPVIKFISVLGIVLTLIVFNVMLAPTRDMALNFKVNSVLFHIVLPLMYVVDWFLFYERKHIKWYYPLLSIIFPLTYVIFIYIRAWILNFDSTVPYIYPYFFLNLDTQGLPGVIKWIFILLAGFILTGYIFFGLEKIKIKNEKK